MNHSRYQISADARLFFVICAVLFGVANFVLVFMTTRARLDGVGIAFVAAAYGVFATQGALHCVWSVLAPLAWPPRLVWAVVVGLFWYATLTLGILVTLPEPFRWDWCKNEAVRILLCAPVVLLAMQAPLWVTRVWLGWQIGHVDDPSMAARAARYGIRHLMAATAVVAFALAAARWAIPEQAHSSRFFVMELAMGALAAAVVSSLTVLPALVAALRTKYPAGYVVGIAGLTFVVLAGVFVVIGTISLSAPPPEVFVFLFFLVAGFYACLGTVLLVVRKLGYRLAWGRHEEPMATAPIESGNPPDEVI